MTIHLFREHKRKATALGDSPFPLEKDLQEMFEANLSELTGIEFLAREYPTSSFRDKRIDTLGIDEYGCPVVIEYKRDSGGDAINQGLEYLHWVLNNEVEYCALVRDRLGHKRQREVNIGRAWLLCIAWSFKHQDVVAAQYCRQRVDLLQVQRFDEGLIALNWILSPVKNPDSEGRETRSDSALPMRPRLELAPEPPPTPEPEPVPPTRSPATPLPDLSGVSGWRMAREDLHALFMELYDFVLYLSETVSVVPYRSYVAFKGNRNIVVVKLYARDNYLLALAAVKPSDVVLQPGFTWDTEGTPLSHNRLGINILSRDDLEGAKQLLSKANEIDLEDEPFNWVD